jgi:hypothetical protein
MRSLHISLLGALVAAATLLSAGCGGENAVVRPAVRDAVDVAARKTEPLRELNSRHGLVCRRTTLEKYRRTALGESADESAGC